MDVAIISKNDAKRKFFDYFIKREIKYINGKEINIYSISSEKPIVIKKLIRRLKKDNIKKLAVVEKEFSEKFKEFNVITTEMVFRNNLVKIIKKMTKTSGLKKGNLKLGIIGETISLKEFIPLGRELKTVFIYSGISDEDLFFKETGIPVIKKMKPAENECEILITDKMLEGKIPETVKYIIEIGKTDIKDSRCISDIRMKNYDKCQFPGIKNCVLNELLGEEVCIAGFVKKTLDIEV